jgi:putative spermidine/putrescine transport system ATP-binding protein
VTAPLVEISGLRKAYGENIVLHDFSLSVVPHECVVLIGASGSGKSTLLRCVNLLEVVDDGTITLEGVDITDPRVDVDAVRSKVGIVFQSFNLFPHLRVLDNITLAPRKVHGLSRDAAEERAMVLLERVGLRDKARSYPDQLSGGQQQRVAIARAIVIEPPLVLMDEPLSNLDAKLRLEMRQEIRRIHAGLGSLTIYVTHDQDEALSLADRIVVMREGAVRQVGTPEDLYARPATIDVADFMGFRNRVAATVTGETAGFVHLDVGGTPLTGTPREALTSKQSIAAIRPDDLVAGAAGIPAIVEAIEYRGRDFFGQARGPLGVELFFRATARLTIGETVRLAAEPDKILVFADPGL